jgi:hypothetical protein
VYGDNAIKKTAVYKWVTCQTIRSITEQANIDRKRVRKILTEDLDMRKMCAKIIPKEFTEEHCL